MKTKYKRPNELNSVYTQNFGQVFCIQINYVCKINYFYRTLRRTFLDTALIVGCLRYVRKLTSSIHGVPEKNFIVCYTNTNCDVIKDINMPSIKTSQNSKDIYSYL